VLRYQRYCAHLAGCSPFRVCHKAGVQCGRQGLLMRRPGVVRTSRLTSGLSRGALRSCGVVGWKRRRQRACHDREGLLAPQNRPRTPPAARTGLQAARAPRRPSCCAEPAELLACPSARAFFAEPLPLCHVGISKNIAPHSRSRSHPCTPSCRPANLVVVAGRPAGRRVRGCWLCAGPSVHGRDDVCWRKGWSARLLRGARQQLCGLELRTGVAMIHHRPPSSRRFGDRFPGPASSDA
jgi:hypothetical protein